MRKSTLNLVISLKANLLAFPRLVNSLEKKQISFLDELILWITKSEEVLIAYNISEVAELAGLRSKLTSPKYIDQRGTSIKKLQLRIAAESLYDIQHVVLKVLNPIELKVEECRELIRQLLLIVSQTQVVKYNQDLPFSELINAVWQFIVSSEQLKPGVIKLKTTLTMSDIQMLIAEEINLEDF